MKQTRCGRSQIADSSPDSTIADPTILHHRRSHCAKSLDSIRPRLRRTRSGATRGGSRRLLRPDPTAAPREQPLAENRVTGGELETQRRGSSCCEPSSSPAPPRSAPASSTNLSSSRALSRNCRSEAAANGDLGDLTPLIFRPSDGVKRRQWLIERWLVPATVFGFRWTQFTGRQRCAQSAGRLYKFSPKYSSFLLRCWRALRDRFSGSKVGCCYSTKPFDGPPSAPKVSPPPQPNASFADKLKARDGSPTEQVFKPWDVPAHDFTILRPELVDLKRCLVLDPSFHQRQVRRFAHAVHGRLILRKGDSPRFAADLWEELQQLWKPSAGWSIHPLGKGFFTFNFTTDEDKAAAFTKTTWRLHSGILHLQAWVPNFDPYKAPSTLVQVWIRIFNLPHEYWHPEVLSGVAREVGTPILIDGQSAQAHVGHFARILVELDVSADIPEALDIKCGDIDFSVKFRYENLPYYCSVCNVVGHTANQCRRSKTTTIAEGFTEHQGRERGQSKVDNHRVDPRPYNGNQESPARAGPLAEVGQKLSSDPTSSNPFAVLVSLELQDEQRLVGDDNMDKPPSDGGRASDACIPQDSQGRKDMEQPGSDDEKKIVEQEHERTSAPLVVQPLAVMTDNNAVLTLTGTTGPISRTRGRPKGAITKKGRVSDSSIKHRLRRIIINGMSSDFQNSTRRDDMHGPGLDASTPVEFLNKVKYAQSEGQILQNFVINSSNSTDAAHAMSVVASSKMKEKWGDWLDDEEDDVLDEEDPLKMFS